MFKIKTVEKSRPAILRPETKRSFTSHSESALFVHKADKLRGTIVAPPSKSYTHRAIIIGSMNGSSQIVNPLHSDDTDGTIEAWKKLGALIEIDPRDNSALIIEGFKGKPKPKAKQIDVREAGTLLRFILPIIGLANEDVTLTGSGTLVDRNNDMIVKPLRSLGLNIDAQGLDRCLLPITVHGKGRIKGGDITIKADTSSQVVSALLIAAPLTEEGITIHVDGPMVSKPYIDITIDVLKQAGIRVIEGSHRFSVEKGQEYRSLDNFVVHGDYSSSAFLMAAACLVDSNVTIRDLVKDKQGDQKIVDILKQFGANIVQTKDSVTIKGPSELKAIEICGTDIPDIVPVIAATAVFAKGRSRIYGIKHLENKESNRRSSLAEELRKLKVDVTATDDELIINGPSSPCVDICHPVSSHSDHRIAMALAIIGVRIGDLSIPNAECISKSYPHFVKDMKSLGANLEII